jgi:hypothetical protein
MTKWCKMSNRHYNIVHYKKKLGGFYALHEVFCVGKKNIIDDNPVITADSELEIISNLEQMLADAKKYQIIVEQTNSGELEKLISFLESKGQNDLYR